jgi:hypothetical protein
VRSLLDGVLALPFAQLPKRYWQTFDLPVASVAPLSALLTLFIGFGIGFRGYFVYLQRLVSVNEVSMLAVGQLQVAGKLPETAAAATAPFAIYMTAPVAYALFTPLGLFATYLLASSVVRLISVYIDEANGDPILTGLDALARRMFTSYRTRSDRAARETLERADEPDRRYSGEWAGLSGVDCVIVSARRKAEWTRGTFVITSDGWFTLGEPFDRPTPNGLRTIYPLTLQTTPDVVRRSVSYDLPPIRMTNATPRKIAETPGPPAES